MTEQHSDPVVRDLGRRIAKLEAEHLDARTLEGRLFGFDKDDHGRLGDLRTLMERNHEEEMNRIDAIERRLGGVSNTVRANLSLDIVKWLAALIAIVIASYLAAHFGTASQVKT